MKKNFKKLLTITGFLALTLSFTSCNRGYGCPNNFSLEQTVKTVVVHTIINLLK
jgi:hypothetical protein